ncbi:MAG: hypothetical protein AAGD38_12435 [Acidobacteriota bacterium]
MSTRATVFACLLISVGIALAQTPTTLNYQGRLLQNTTDQDAATGTVDIRFSIWTGPATEGTATELWNETWTDVTLSNGIFSVLLGSNGSPLDPADFQGDTSLFLQLEVDGETLSPRQQLGSAPFAFVDEPANELQVLSLSGTTLQLTSADGTDTVELTNFLEDLDTVRTVFVTSATYDGNFGGLEGADAACQTLADAAELGGTYQAWLSDSAESPSTRFDQLGSFAMIDGTVIANDWADLTDGGLQNVLNLTETNETLGVGELVRTSTMDDGTAETLNCDDWSTSDTGVQATAGQVSGTSSPWTDSGFVVACNLELRLYCFERSPLSTYLDNTDNQVLSLNGNDLELTSDDGTDVVDLSSFLDDTDDQMLSLSDTTLQLTSDDGTDSVDLSGFLDDTTIDNQVLSLSGDTLSLTSDDGTDTVDLSPYLDDSDEQTLSLSGDTVTISESDSSIDLTSADSIATMLTIIDALTNIVFVTSTNQTGSFGGLDAADAICQGLADAAGLDGTFKAWLSDTTDSPSTRFTQSEFIYVLVDGTKIADDWDDLTDGTIDATISLDENGDTTDSTDVYTNTTSAGEVRATNSTLLCDNWTSDVSTDFGIVGLTNATDETWSTDSAGALLTSCANTNAVLYCFEQ